MDEATSPETEVEIEEQPTAEAEEVETETAEVTDETEADEDSDYLDDESEEDVEDEEDEAEEVDYEGKTYKLPKELKEALLRQADYPRKTTELAEQRRELEAERQRVQQSAQRQQEYLRDYATLASIDQQSQAMQGELQQLNTVNLAELDQTDPNQAQAIRNRRIDLQSNLMQLGQIRQNTETSLSQREQQAVQEQQAQLVKRLEQGKQVLQKEIKDWSPELASKLADFGTQMGFSRDEMQQVADPRHVKLLHKAYLYEQAQSKAKAVGKKKPIPATPVTKVSGKSGKAKIDPDKLPIDQWMKWDDQRQKRRGR